MEQDAYRFCRALVQLIRFNGGQKDFSQEDFSDEAYGYLAQLEADGVIVRIASEDPVSCIYQLKDDR